MPTSETKRSDQYDKVQVFEYINMSTAQTAYGTRPPAGLHWPRSGRWFQLYENDGTSGDLEVEKRQALFCVDEGDTTSTASRFRLYYEGQGPSGRPRTLLGYLSHGTNELPPFMPDEEQIHRFQHDQHIFADRFGVDPAPSDYSDSGEYFNGAALTPGCYRFKARLVGEQLEILNSNGQPIEQDTESGERTIQVPPARGNVLHFELDTLEHPTLEFGMFYLTFKEQDPSRGGGGSANKERFRIASWSANEILIVDDNDLDPTDKDEEYSFTLSVYDTEKGLYYDDDPKIQNRSGIGGTATR